MLERFYFLMIMKFLKKNIIFEKKKYKLIFNNKEKKILFSFFFNLRRDINTRFVFFNNNKDKLISSHILTVINQNSKNKSHQKNSLFFYQLKLNNLSYSLNNLDEIYGLYLNFFVEKSLYDSSYYNRIYTNLYLEKKKVLILSNFFLKKNFFKIIRFLIEGSFLNLKPLLIIDDKINEGSDIMKDYLNFLNKSTRYDYVFICNPFVKLKFISKIKNLNLPVFSIVDHKINESWIDYPIYINKIDNFSIYFFFCLFFQIFSFGQQIKKKCYTKLYEDFLTLNYVKEYIFDREVE